MKELDTTRKILIDTDNAQYSKLKPIIDEISTHGHIVSKRAYGDWSSDYLKNWKKVLIGPSIPSIRKISDSNQKKLRNYKTRSGSSPVNTYIKVYRGRND